MNVRNGAATLREAVDSVLGQTFGDWELIVWDDCSTDESARVIQEYKDPRIRYLLSPEDTPLGRARDMAIRKATSEWVAFLDQDDVWLPRKLEKQLALDDGPRVGLIYGRTMRFSASGSEWDFDHRHEYKPLPEGDIFARLFVDSCYIAMSSAMMRRKAIEELGGIPDVIRVTPDYYLFAGVARHYEARAVQEVVCRYRWSGGMSASVGPQIQKEILWLVDHWAGDLDPKLVKHRRQVHNTVLAIMEMRTGAFVAGMSRMLAKGSASYLLSRPSAIYGRAIRRRLARPYWKMLAGERSLPTVSGAVFADDWPLALSVIVVNWNVRDLLRDCLRSLYEETQLPRDQWEVIVVDNNSDDSSVEMVRNEFPAVRLFANQENIGFGRANNQAFEVCRGKQILLLNPDTIVQNRAIERMMEVMRERPDVGVLGCELQNGDGSFQRWTGGYPPTLGTVICHFLLLYKVLPGWMLPPPLYLEHEPKEDMEVGWVSGACMLLRREALSRRMFDERFFLYVEDLELCDRLAKSGWKVLYTPKTKIVHLDGRSLAKSTPEIQASKLRSLRKAFAIRNPSRIKMLIYDVVVSVGFALRAGIFGAGALFRPGRGYEPKANESRKFLRQALRDIAK